MKKILSLLMVCLMALTLSAQRAAVLEFKAGSGISQADVDGISAIFITYFRPEGYTMVERTQIDRVIDEQGFQRGRLTEQQMVKIGQILNVSKVVVGDINVVMGQYNVDVRALNVQSGTIAATEGATFQGTSYRDCMKSIAIKLAGKIAIKAGSTVPATPTPKPQPQEVRTTPYVIYGYLKVFPNDLGTFESKPTTVIAQINKASQHGYNTWRIPTKEELSLMVANNVITSTSDYMASDGRSSGKVRLVTDTETAEARAKAEAEAEARAKAKAEAEAQAEAKAKAEAEAREKAELQRKIENARAMGYVYLGLPSGTLWKDKNEDGGFYSHVIARITLDIWRLPSKKQFEELKSSCQWNWTGNGYKVVGPSGEYIFLPAEGRGYDSGDVDGVGKFGCYWSRTSNGSDDAGILYFNSSRVSVDYSNQRNRFSVRLVK